MGIDFDNKVLHEFYSAISITEEPMGIFYTDTEPAEGISPKPAKLPTYEEEQQGADACRAIAGNRV